MCGVDVTTLGTQSIVSTYTRKPSMCPRFSSRYSMAQIFSKIFHHFSSMCSAIFPFLHIKKKNRLCSHICPENPVSVQGSVQNIAWRRFYHQYFIAFLPCAPLCIHICIFKNLKFNPLCSHICIFKKKRLNHYFPIFKKKKD